MSGKKIEYKIPNAGFVLDQIQHLYSSPHLAFKEYLSNSIDNHGNEIKIYVSKANNLLIIQDNGTGMSIADLEKIPQSIGTSSKRGIESARGEKAFGLLAYPSLGANQCQIFSKNSPDSRTYNYLRMNKDNLEDAFVDEMSGDSLLDSEIEFEKGTRVVLNGISEDIINRYFTPSVIKDFVGDMFAPLLRRGVVEVTVGYSGKKTKLIPVEAPQYLGEKVLEDIIQHEYNKDGKKIVGEIELRLFVNSKGTNDKVRHYNKGVKVLNSLSFYDELSEMPWESGKLLGEVNENFLTLIPSREAPVRTGSRYEFFINTLKESEDYLNEEIDRLKVNYEKHECEDFANNFLRAIDAVVRDMREQYPSWVRGKEGDEKKKVIEEGGEGSTHMGEKSASEPDEHNRSAVKPDERGKEDFIRRARKVISSFYQPKFEVFGLEKQNLRSELDTVFNHIKINIGHPEYKERSKKDERNKYVALILSKEIAYGEFKQLIERSEIKDSARAVEQAHNLTEIITEFYNKGLKGMGLD